MTTDPESGIVSRATDAVSTRGRRLGGALLDRVGVRAAAALHDELLTSRAEIDALRDELARTRTELEADIELLRAEVAGR